MNQQEGIKKLGDMIKDIRIAMLTTEGSGGYLHSRPMYTQQMPFDGKLWFFSRYDSSKTQEISTDARVNLSYSDPDHSRYVSIAGSARMIRERSKMEEFWNPAYRTFFPQGLDDPQICLIQVTAEHAEYWDSPSSKMVRILGLGEIAASGKPVRPSELGENQKIDLAG